MENILVPKNHTFKKQRTDKIGLGKKFYIETLGCQMNVADSELIIAMLNNEGVRKVQ